MTRGPIPSFAALVLTAAAFAPPVLSQSTADYEALGRIRDEGFRRSQVMETVRHLTDAIGPRLTGSREMRAANDWTKGKLTEWGLANARLEPYDFGEGWSFSRSEVRMTKPLTAVLVAFPKAWTPGTNGTVRGTVKKAKIESAADLDALAGQLAGTILLLEPTVEPRSRPTAKEFERWDDAKLADLERYDIPAERDAEAWRERRNKSRKVWLEIADRLVAEGVVAMLETSSFENGVVRTGGHASQGMPGVPLGPPQIAMTKEGYERISRLIDDGAEVELELTVDVEFQRDSKQAWNTVAEIPGSSRASEIVIAGAHLDSWHLGTGATDNAAGSVIVQLVASTTRSVAVNGGI